MANNEGVGLDLRDITAAGLQKAIWNERNPDLRAYLARVLPMHSGYRYWEVEGDWTPDGMILRVIVDMSELPGFGADTHTITLSYRLDELPEGLREQAVRDTAKAATLIPPIPDNAAELLGED